MDGRSQIEGFGGNEICTAPKKPENEEWWFSGRNSSLPKFVVGFIIGTVDIGYSGLRL